MFNLLCVMAGGALGSGLRFCVGMLPFGSSSMPWPTLAVNLVGSFVLGWLASIGTGSVSDRTPLMLFLGPGLCGGFTTYSAFAVETTTLLERQDVTLMIIYTLTTVIGGMLLAFLGFSIARSGS